MSRLSPEIERMLEQVELAPGAPSGAASNIRAAIESSPYLQQRMDREIEQSNLKGIAVRERDAEWGHFDDPKRTASLDVDLFKDFAGNKKDLEDAITYVLGHEVGHGNNLAERTRAKDALGDGVSRPYWDLESDGYVDITPAVNRYVKFAGTDETRAEIEGWNALVSRVETERGNVDMDDLMKRAFPVSSFVEQDGQKFKAVDGVDLKAGPYLTYQKPPGTGQVSPSAEAISSVYYSPALQARYAAAAVEMAHAATEEFKQQTQQTPYETRLNFSAIGQTPESLEKAGLDLGGKGKTFPITDTSQGMNWIQLKHTRDKGEQDKPSIEPDSQSRTFTPDQPGFRYYDQALEAIRNSPNIAAGTFDKEQEERLAGSMAKAALSNTPPLKNIDSVVVSKINPDTGKPENIFAVQGGLSDPGHVRAHERLDVALAAPVEQTSQDVNKLAVVRQQEMQQELEQQQQVQQQQRGPVIA